MSSIQFVLLIILFMLALALKIDLNYSIRIRKLVSSNFYPMEIIIRKGYVFFFLKKKINLLIKCILLS